MDLHVACKCQFISVLCITCIFVIFSALDYTYTVLVCFFMELNYVMYLDSIFNVVDYLQCWGILLVLLGINSAEDC